MDVYPPFGQDDHPCRFQACRFKLFPWLEYSPEYASFCFTCYLFSKKIKSFYFKMIQKLEKGT